MADAPIADLVGGAEGGLEEAFRRLTLDAEAPPPLPVGAPDDEEVRS